MKPIKTLLNPIKTDENPIETLRGLPLLAGLQDVVVQGGGPAVSPHDVMFDVVLALAQLECLHEPPEVCMEIVHLIFEVALCRDTGLGAHCCTLNGYQI